MPLFRVGLHLRDGVAAPPVGAMVVVALHQPHMAVMVSRLLVLGLAEVMTGGMMGEGALHVVDDHQGLVIVMIEEADMMMEEIGGEDGAVADHGQGPLVVGVVDFQGHEEGPLHLLGARGELP